MGAKVLLTNSFDSRSFSFFQSLFPSGFSVVQLHSLDKKSFMEEAAEADYLVVSGRLRVDDDIVRVSKRLKMAARVGTGLDCLDLESLSRASVPVYACAGINSDSVAEHTVLLILSLLRKIDEFASQTKHGMWNTNAARFGTHELKGKEVCVVGAAGAIGKKVTNLIRGFGCSVIECDLGSNPPFPQCAGNSDIVTFHCPFTEDTRDMLDSRAIAALKRGCLIVNTSRGGLINEEDLAEALESGAIGGVALDVRTIEPPDPTGPFTNAGNVILTPHMAGITQESFEEMMRMAANSVISFHNGNLHAIAPHLLRANGE